jgi:hypothetical protein
MQNGGTSSRCWLTLAMMSVLFSSTLAFNVLSVSKPEPRRLSSNICASKEDKTLVYRSGIPTLRSSAHRVKLAPKNRKQDPKPRDRDGRETNTVWLPPELLSHQVLAYDTSKSELKGTVISMLKRCDPEIVGTFRDDDASRLEDFCVPVPSVWRSVNGGRCEDAQKYLSDAVSSDQVFLDTFDTLMKEVILPSLKQRLVDAGAIQDSKLTTTFYYQRPPTLRLQPGPAWAEVRPHNDAQYGHQNGELNFWLPLTDRTLTGVDLWSESSFQANDFAPISASMGQVVSFHGSSCRHYVNPNQSTFTRVSLDFRVGVGGFFDPYWQMRGTTDDHGRQELKL